MAMAMGTLGTARIPRARLRLRVLWSRADSLSCARLRVLRGKGSRQGRLGTRRQARTRVDWARRLRRMEMQRERRRGRLRRSTSEPSSIEGFTEKESAVRASAIELDKGENEE